MRRLVPIALLLALVLAVPRTASPEVPKDSPVKGVCAACHAPGRDGSQEVVDEIRTTPEGWRRIVARMERAYGVKLDDATRERAVRDLSEAYPLSQAEYAELRTDVARMGTDALPAGEYPDEFEKTCTACHTYEVFASQRRTPDGWQRVRDMHLGTWPNLFLTHREMRWDERSAQAVKYLAKRFPIAGKPARFPGSLAGDYALVGSKTGAGGYTGRLAVTLQPDGKVAWKETRRFDDGRTEEASGSGTATAGYLLELDDKRTLFRRPGDDGLEGKAEKAFPAGKPRLLHVFPAAVIGDVAEATLTLTLTAPGKATPRCDDPKVRIVKATPDGDRLQLHLQVPKGLKPGVRTFTMPGVPGAVQVAFAPAVQALRVVPEVSVARLGGGHTPAVPVQFECRGRHAGADGKLDTADDLDLGPVPVQWRMSDYASTNWDQDARWVGTLDGKGFFAPASAEPNPERKRLINTGSVWIAATHRPEGARHALRARVLLRVSPPDYREDL